MDLRKTCILAFITLLCFIRVSGIEIICNKQDSIVYEEYIKQFSSQKEKPVQELIVNTAKYFIGKPYVASTLEVSDDSKLVVNLREFDCMTFVETCIALSGTIKSGDTSLENYCRILSFIRYRNEKPEGYTSRLHYTIDWIYENSEKGIFKDISTELRGEYVQKDINFMSSKSELYKQLKNNPANLDKIKQIEDTINSRNNYNIISTSTIRTNQKKIKDGDIIAFATSVKGLDYSHLGIAYYVNKQLHFIHASSRVNKVIIENKTLENYCRDSKNCIGISVLRING